MKAERDRYKTRAEALAAGLRVIVNGSGDAVTQWLIDHDAHRGIADVGINHKRLLIAETLLAQLDSRKGDTP